MFRRPKFLGVPVVHASERFLRLSQKKNPFFIESNLRALCMHTQPTRDKAVFRITHMRFPHRNVQFEGGMNHVRQSNATRITQTSSPTKYCLSCSTAGLIFRKATQINRLNAAIQPTKESTLVMMSVHGR